MIRLVRTITYIFADEAEMKRHLLNAVEDGEHPTWQGKPHIVSSEPEYVEDGQ